MKTFTVAGTSVKKGQTKFRTANTLAARIKMLEADGQTDVNLVELPQAMSKVDAARYLIGEPKFASVEQQLALKLALHEEQAPEVITATEEPAQEPTEEPVVALEVVAEAEVVVEQVPEEVVVVEPEQPVEEPVAKVKKPSKKKAKKEVEVA
jgi:hypothetical protein